MDDNKSFGLTLNRIWFYVKRNLWLVLAIIVLASSLGLAVFHFREPNYIAKEDVIYRANLNENKVHSNDPIITQSYFSTVVDFFNSGCVVDRANFYYSKYLENKESYKTLDDFVSAVDGAKEGDDLYYSVEKRVNNTHIYPSGISVETLNSEKSENYEIIVGYKDGDVERAKQKVKIVILAVEKEANAKTPAGKYKYFSVKITIEDMKLIGVTGDCTLHKVLMISFLLGVLLSVVVVYAKESFNLTIREVEDLEEITGLNNLACLEKQGGNYGKSK